jgi:hypothetical protein
MNLNGFSRLIKPDTFKMKKDNRKKVKAKAKAGGNDDEINKMFEENAKTRPKKKQITF